MSSNAVNCQISNSNNSHVNLWGRNETNTLYARTSMSVWWHVFHNGITWRPRETFWYDDKWWVHCISRYVVCPPTISNLCLRRQQPGEECQLSRARSGKRWGSGSVQRWARRLPSWALQSHTAGGGKPRSGSGASLHAPRASFWDRTGLWTSQATWRRDRGTNMRY